MISLLEPFGNTETFGWPMSCHMPYWVEDGRTLLSSSAVFGFLGINSVHNYKCYSFHLEYHGLKNAFAGDSENDGSLISLEAFLHFLFGGLFPFCHCEKGSPSSKIPEVRKFFMERLTKGQSIEMSSPSETREPPTNLFSTSRNPGEPKEQCGLKISKCYSIEAQDSFRHGGMLNEQCTETQRSDSGTGAVISSGNNNVRMIMDTDFNGDSGERMDDDGRSSDHHVTVMQRDSQTRQVHDQLNNRSSFVSNAAVEPNRQIENNSLLDSASVRLHEQRVSAGFGSVACNVEPNEYTPRQVKKHKSLKPCAVEDGSLSQAVAQSVSDPTVFGADGDDKGAQSGKFSAVIVKQENVEDELEGGQCMSSSALVTDSNLENSEGLELGNNKEEHAIDCGPMEIVLLPQEIATGASYFDPSTSSITTGSADSHMTSLQQSEKSSNHSVGLSTESSHTFEHSSSVEETPDSISRHLQYSQSVERENIHRITARGSDQNHDINLGIHSDASQWRMPSFTASARQKPRKSGAASTCSSTNISQLHQEPSPCSATVVRHNKRMRTNVESATVTTNIPRHTSAPTTTELNKIPSWISLGSTLNVMSGAPRQELNTGNTSSVNSSVSPITRLPVPYTQGTSLLNSNTCIGPASSSSATGMPSVKAAQERTDNSTPRKAVRTQCIRCRLLVESLTDHNCHQMNKCPACGREFTQQKDVKRHMLTHTGEKPYRCSYKGCTKTFGRKDSLNRHILRFFHKQT